MEAKLQLQPAVDESYPEPHAHLTTLTAPTTSMLDMTSYSHSAVTTSYPLDLHPSGHQQPPPPPHYYSEFDWQHGATTVSAAADPSAHAPGSFYGFAGDRQDLSAASVQLYHGFPGGMAPHTADLYASSPALWHHPPTSTLVDDQVHTSTALTSERYLPSLTRALGSSSSTSSSSNSSTSTPNSSGKPKRRRVQSLNQRKAANVRERRRMYHLNTAFDELRKRLPAFNYEKRLSRIETLRLAMTYIGFMKDVSMGEDPRKVKLRAGTSDAGSDLSHLDMESCTSEDPQHEDLES